MALLQAFCAEEFLSLVVYFEQASYVAGEGFLQAVDNPCRIAIAIHIKRDFIVNRTLIEAIFFR